MKLVRISERAKVFLRNRNLASAVSKALAQSGSRDGIVVKVNGKIYTVKSATSVAGKKIA
jgi:hypothetical protein